MCKLKATNNRREFQESPFQENIFTSRIEKQTARNWKGSADHAKRMQTFVIVYLPRRMKSRTQGQKKPRYLVWGKREKEGRERRVQLEGGEYEMANGCFHGWSWEDVVLDTRIMPFFIFLVDWFSAVGLPTRHMSKNVRTPRFESFLLR